MIYTPNANARKFLIWTGAIIVVLIAVMLIRGSTKVKTPAPAES